MEWFVSNIVDRLEGQTVHTTDQHKHATSLAETTTVRIRNTGVWHSPKHDGTRALTGQWTHETVGSTVCLT